MNCVRETKNSRNDTKAKLNEPMTDGNFTREMNEAKTRGGQASNCGKLTKNDDIYLK